MIDRVHFENFKSLQNLTLELGQLTALVGPNGCGKSSVLQGIQLLAERAIQSRGGNVHALPVRLRFRGMRDKMILAMSNPGDDELRVESGPDVGKQDLEKTVRPVRSLHEFASVAYLHLDATEMARTSVPVDEQPRMEQDGTGLASALAWMKGAAEDDFAQLTTDLRQVVPGVKRIRTLRERVTQRRMERIDIDGQPVWRPVDESQIGDRFEIEFDDGSAIPADLLSEGTVLVLGLLTKLREPERPRLILIDDIDRGLHLGAQTSLIKALREMMKRDPDLQIVCTTHSPYLLDLFEPAEVRVLALDSERRTHARPLVEHPDFEKWKFGTQVGELWAALGEDWVIGGAGG